MHKKFDINQTKIKGSCQPGRKVVTHNSGSDLPLAQNKKIITYLDLAFLGLKYICILRKLSKKQTIANIAVPLEWSGVEKKYKNLSTYIVL